MQGAATRPVPQLLQVSSALAVCCCCVPVCGGKQGFRSAMHSQRARPQLGCLSTCRMNWNAAFVIWTVNRHTSTASCSSEVRRVCGESTLVTRRALPGVGLCWLLQGPICAEEAQPQQQQPMACHAGGWAPGAGHWAGMCRTPSNCSPGQHA